MENYNTIYGFFYTEKLAVACDIGVFDLKSLLESFKNGHYSRGILATVLRNELNSKVNSRNSSIFRIFEHCNYYYGINYEKFGKKISLEKKKDKDTILEKCTFYDLKLDKCHYQKPFDGENIFAEVRDIGYAQIRFCFHVPKWFDTDP